MQNSLATIEIYMKLCYNNLKLENIERQNIHTYDIYRKWINLPCISDLLEKSTT